MFDTTEKLACMRSIKYKDLFTNVFTCNPLIFRKITSGLSEL